MSLTQRTTIRWVWGLGLWLLVLMVGLGSQSAHATNLKRCDVDRDSDIDKQDIARVTAALGSRATSGPFDPRDGDGNGRIQFKDVKICAARGTQIRVRRSESSVTKVFNVRQATPTAAAIANELDDANRSNSPLLVSIAGSPTFNAGTCVQP